MNKKIFLIGLLMLSLMATACVTQIPEEKADSSFYDCIDMCGDLKKDNFVEENMEICTDEIYQNYYDWNLFDERDDIRRDCTIEDDDEDAADGAEKLDFDCMTTFCTTEVEDKFDEYCFDYCS